MAARYTLHVTRVFVSVTVGVAVPVRSAAQPKDRTDVPYVKAELTADAPSFLVDSLDVSRDRQLRSLDASRAEARSRLAAAQKARVVKGGVPSDQIEFPTQAAKAADIKVQLARVERIEDEIIAIRSDPRHVGELAWAPTAGDIGGLGGRTRARVIRCETGTEALAEAVQTAPDGTTLNKKQILVVSPGNRFADGFDIGRWTVLHVGGTKTLSDGSMVRVYQTVDLSRYVKGERPAPKLGKGEVPFVEWPLVPGAPAYLADGFRSSRLAHISKSEDDLAYSEARLKLLNAMPITGRQTDTTFESADVKRHQMNISTSSIESARATITALKTNPDSLLGRGLTNPSSRFTSQMEVHQVANARHFNTAKVLRVLGPDEALVQIRIDMAGSVQGDADARRIVLQRRTAGLADGDPVDLGKDVLHVKDTRRLDGVGTVFVVESVRLGEFLVRPEGKKP